MTLLKLLNKILAILTPLELIMHRSKEIQEQAKELLPEGILIKEEEKKPAAKKKAQQASLGKSSKQVSTKKVATPKVVSIKAAPKSKKTTTKKA